MEPQLGSDPESLELAVAHFQKHRSHGQNSLSGAYVAVIWNAYSKATIGSIFGVLTMAHIGLKSDSPFGEPDAAAT